MRKFRILLVEDSEDDVLIIQRAFKTLHLGHELVAVGSGEAALEGLTGGALRADLVLLDLNLPGLSGFDVLRRIRSVPTLRSLPVTVLSASDREPDVQEAYEAGANHYLVKPLRFESFLELLRQWTEYWTRLGRLPLSS